MLYSTAYFMPNKSIKLTTRGSHARLNGNRLWGSFGQGTVGGVWGEIWESGGKGDDREACPVWVTERVVSFVWPGGHCLLPEWVSGYVNMLMHKVCLAWPICVCLD